MTSHRLENVEDIFVAARDLSSEGRKSHLDEHCGDDAALRAEIESLLRHYDAAGDFLATPAAGIAFGRLLDDSHQARSTALPPGTQLGPYLLKNVLNEGGMGVVYLAEQDSPRRTVALKVLKPDVQTPEMLSRFVNEGQVLGWLQHPGIAQIFQAGTAETKQGTIPYFAMELIEGETLTKYAAAHELGTHARLRLLATVCDAVHHAHQKGVIHRDLKPANILVDVHGQPKILDFGIARVTDADIRTTTMQTDVGNLVGTIAYMSPEQLGGRSRDLDTRSDVYALGVIAYELLAGRLPHDVVDKSVPHAARLIEETDPPRLSSVDKVFRGDIQTIVTKALEKQKERRYQSALDFAADIRRYLSNQPIAARPATTIYQLRKFARRNRALVASIALLFVVLSGGLIRVTWERNRAVRAERLAESRRDEAESQRAQAEAEARKAQAINDFMQRVFSSVDPAQTMGRRVPFRFVLDQAADRIESDLPDQPDVQASVHETLGKTFRSLGYLDESESHLRAALDNRRRRLGDEHPLTLAAMNELALTLQEQGNLPEAERIFRRLLAVHRRLKGPEHEKTVLGTNNLGWVLLARGQFQEAESLFRRALTIRQRISGDEHPETLRTMVNLAATLRRLGRLDEAETLSRRSTEACRRVLGDRHPTTLYAVRDRVWLLKQENRLEEAESLGRQAVTLDRQVLGDEHPRTLHSMNNLAAILARQGNHSDAEMMHRDVLRARRTTLGEEHLDTLASMNNLATVLFTQRKLDEAEPLYDEVLTLRRRVLGPEHPETLSAAYNFALLCRNRGNLEKAELLFSDVLAGRRIVLGVDHRRTLEVMQRLADLYRSRKRYDEARSLLAEILDVRRRIDGEAHRETLAATLQLADIYHLMERCDEATPLFEGAIEGARDALPDGDWYTGVFQMRFAECLAGRNRFVEAEDALLDAHRILAAALGEEHGRVAAAVTALIENYDAWGKPDRADEWRQKRGTTPQ